jgi:DNA-binding CsgD family transcriptional regulator/ligand-binding sensor domain-containing protein
MHVTNRYRQSMKTYLSITLLLIQQLWLIQPSKAENQSFGIPEIQYFNRSSYKGGTQNWCISQSANGLLYVANNVGIMEYDGSSWRVLPKISQSITRAVLADGDKIYVAAFDEFGYYQQNGGADFKYVSLNKKYNIEEAGDFWAIFKFNDIIVFQSEKALCVYRPQKGVEVIKARSRIPNAFLVNGMLLVHDELDGLMEFRQDRLFKIPGGEKFAGVRIGAILPMPNDELVIGTMTDGLYLYGNNGITKWNVPANDFLTRSNVFCGTKNGDELVFGTIQSGVVVTDPKGQIKSIITKDRGLWNNTVLGLFVDSDKHIWAGLDNGIAKIAYNTSVSFLNGYFDLGTGYCATRKMGNVYLGTNQGLYIISEPQFYSPEKDRNSFKRITGSNGQVWSLFAANGSLLCGHNNGVYKITGDKANLITPPSVVGAWCFREVPNRPDLIMVGTYNGMALLKHVAGEWKFECKIDKFNESTRFMEWDTDGGLWISHGVKGLFKVYFDPSYNSIKEIKRALEFKGLDDDKNMTLTSINGKVLFVSTHGLMQFEASKGTFSINKLNDYFTKDNSPIPSTIVPDEHGNIWFFSSIGSGVLRIQEDGSYRKVTNPFASFNNKLVNGFESIFSWDEKNALFGAEDGFAHYSVTDKTNFETPFSVHIRGFSGAAQHDSIYYINKNDISAQHPIPVYPFANNAFDVSYSATWYGSGNIVYSTYLEGFDSKWGEWDILEKRQFTRLPEGKYVFWVKARNIHGVESDPIGFKFEILPPWYRSVWAKIAYILLVLGLLALLALITRRIIEKSRRREMLNQQEAFKQKEEQLMHEALVNEKEMIRLRNETLNNEMLHKEKELANSAMHMIKKNEFLIKIKEDLLKALSNRDLDLVGKRIGQMVRRIDNDIDNDSHWEVFETHLGQVHEEFLKKLQQQHPDLLSRELKLCAYLRMGMSSKEIASLMNISARAVENNRSKLRKKLGIDPSDNLQEYVNRL